MKEYLSQTARKMTFFVLRTFLRAPELIQNVESGEKLMLQTACNRLATGRLQTKTSRLQSRLSLLQADCRRKQADYRLD